ncbi:MAG TPA: aspartate aminotransferase family protein [Jatrophihabitans sp.]|jgi:ornithine--oxo-acid transaminase|nr:aspartate aminotransferase family protein [Jatrophihabitans sp.]
MGADEPFDLRDVLRRYGDRRYDLHAEHLNPQLPRMLRAIGFDRTYVRGEGAYLYDEQGREYLDMLAGFGVFALGRHHPAVRQAMHDVLDLGLADLTQFDAPPLAGALADVLLARVPHLDRVYFSNSGTEAVEAALKFARYYTRRRRIVYCAHAFHGLTAGSLSVNGAKEFRKGFGPLLPGTAIPFGDLPALERELARGDVAGFLIEPIQGKGVAVSPPGFLAEAQRLVHRHGALLIADEVQCGIGRTGDFFAYEHDGVQPDLVATAKALSGGYVPIGATLGRDAIFRKVYSSMDRVLVHDSTFGSNAQAMAAGLATLHTLEAEDVLENARSVGAELQRRLLELADRYEMIAEVRGRGLMIGIEFRAPASSRRLRAHWRALQLARTGLFAQTVVHALFHRHRILTQVSGDHLEVIKLIPPLIIGPAEVDRFVTALDDVLSDAHSGARLTRDFGRMLAANTMLAANGLRRR